MNDASPRLTERGRQRRRAMLDAATQAFLEHGFEGTTLDMVIERAGGSRGTLYSSFGGKEGLFAAVIAHMIEEIFDDSADQPRPAATLSATLEHFGRRFLTSLLDPRCQSLYAWWWRNLRGFRRSASPSTSRGRSRATCCSASDW